MLFICFLPTTIHYNIFSSFLQWTCGGTSDFLLHAFHQSLPQAESSKYVFIFTFGFKMFIFIYRMFAAIVISYSFYEKRANRSMHCKICLPNFCLWGTFNWFTEDHFIDFPDRSMSIGILWGEYSFLSHHLNVS